MTKTPTKTEIEKHAIEIWFNEQFKNGVMNPNTPEIEELKECGAWSQAVSELMRNNHRSEIESDFIDYPKEFNVDIEQLFESNGLILGSRHTGKSDLAMMIADKCMEKGSIVVCFDPSLDWITRSSIKQYVKVEPYAVLDVPTESIVYDVSLCAPNQQQAIVERFSKSLFEYQVKTLNRKEYLVIFEEAHTYFYQNIMRSKNAVHSVRMLSVGRNVEICCLLISQFASMLDKFAIKHSVSQIYLGFTKEPNDLKYLKQFLGSEVQQLTKLNDGEFLYLTRSGIQKIQIEPYNSTTPKTQFFAKIPELQLSPIPQANSNGIIELIKLAVVSGIFIYAIVSMPR
jgi:predicted  nucleic acid-binding Zn-ribbon protein